MSKKLSRNKFGRRRTLSEREMYIFTNDIANRLFSRFATCASRLERLYLQEIKASLESITDGAVNRLYTSGRLTNEYKEGKNVKKLLLTGEKELIK